MHNKSLRAQNKSLRTQNKSLHAQKHKIKVYAHKIKVYAHTRFLRAENAFFAQKQHISARGCVRFFIYNIYGMLTNAGYRMYIYVCI